jgi:hypothetical protein
VGDSVDDDVCEVIVDESIENFSSVAFAADDARCFENAQMLADEWLSDAESADEFVNAALRLVELKHDRDANGCSQRPQNFAGGRQSFLGRHGRGRCGFERVVRVSEVGMIMAFVEIAGIRNAHSEAPSRGRS